MPTPQWKTPDGLERKWGFDNTTMPNWLMAGLSETDQESSKSMELLFAAGDQVVSVNPRIADIKEEAGSPDASGKRWFWITAKTPGRTRIEVRDAKTKALKSILTVRVKRLRRIRLSFHFVEDKLGNKTVRKPDIVDGLIDKLNNIYETQTNVRFEMFGVDGNSKVDAILGDVVRQETDGRSKQLTGETQIVGRDTWRQIFAKKRDRLADFNIYFVPTDDPVNTNRNDLAYWDFDNCVIEDGFVGLDVSLPHALGRMLGCPATFDFNHIQQLMFWDNAALRNDDFIPKACTNIMNP
jgi:hypothetical protein